MAGRHHLKILILAALGILLVSAVGLTACSYQATPSAPAAPPASAPAGAAGASPSPAGQLSVKADVTLSNFAFSPATVTIPVGAAVIWTNKDSTTHTITSDDSLFESGNLSPGKTFSFTFRQTGTYNYHCSIHPSMTGKIVVGQ